MKIRIIERGAMDVPGTDLRIAKVEDGGEKHWWLLGAGDELLWIIDTEIATGLITALTEWREKHGDAK